MDENKTIETYIEWITGFCIPTIVNETLLAQTDDGPYKLMTRQLGFSCPVTLLYMHTHSYIFIYKYVCKNPMNLTFEIYKCYFLK